MGGRASAERAELMGAQLAQMHRSLSPNGKYGFHVDNTIGGAFPSYEFGFSVRHPIFLLLLLLPSLDVSIRIEPTLNDLLPHPATGDSQGSVLLAQGSRICLLLVVVAFELLERERSQQSTLLGSFKATHETHRQVSEKHTPAVSGAELMSQPAAQKKSAQAKRISKC